MSLHVQCIVHSIILFTTVFFKPSSNHKIYSHFSCWQSIFFSMWNGINCLNSILFPFLLVPPASYISSLFNGSPCKIEMPETISLIKVSTHAVDLKPSIHNSTYRNNKLNAARLYCTVLYCTVLYCTALYCTVLYCTVLYCSVL